MRLIDADGLKQRILAFCTACRTTFLSVDGIVTAINHTDTEDAVPVVRCGECQHWGDEDGINTRYDGARYARCKIHNTYVGNGRHVGWCPTEDDYCSQGEEKP